MWVKYLNLDYWFYQIYLLLGAVYYYLVEVPQTLYSGVYNIILLFFSFTVFIWLVYSWYKTRLIRRKEQEVFLAGFITAADPKTEKQEEWQDIIDHADSENEAQWKLALIDADKIMENLLRENKFVGEGVGEMLKSVETEGGLKSLQDAWEAHKIRNRIAHESGFVLTKREARRAVELYKKVFAELNFF